MDTKETARRAISLMDLTSLGDDDDAEKVKTLCEQALKASVAAVCVWPQFVNLCCRMLDSTNIKIATVVNFPHGGSDIKQAIDETAHALDEGANEIDLVMPYAAWLKGDKEVARDMIAQVKTACTDKALLKVILETGSLQTNENIANASRDAIAAGADFIKTSTGKTSVSAAPEAAEVMLNVIRESRKAIGFKASGGIRTVEQAGLYLGIASRVMQPGWAQPGTFRFGASGLLNTCEKVLSDG